MGNFVQISREELENWLESIILHDKWYLQPNKAGVYILPLSKTVAVKLNSTIGTRNEAMGVGQASMQLSLVSLITGQVLNKKAQGQNHFSRTINWRDTWRKGIDRFKEAYIKSQGFYDAIAVIQDREAYKRDLLKTIEDYPGWAAHNILADFHKKVLTGGVLTAKQIDLLNDIVSKKPDMAPEPIVTDEVLLNRLRLLYSQARTSNDNWLMSFVESIGKQVKAGRPLSPKQQDAMEKAFIRYKVGNLNLRWIVRQEMFKLSHR